jgi:hypothetical protein
MNLLIHHSIKAPQADGVSPNMNKFTVGVSAIFALASREGIKIRFTDISFLTEL